MKLLSILNEFENHLNEETIEVDYTPVQVWDNLNGYGANKALLKTSEKLLRGLLDLNSEKTYYWDAMLATHDDAAMELGISDYTEFLVGLNTGGVANINNIGSDSIMRRAFVGTKLIVYARSIKNIDQFASVARLMLNDGPVETIRIAA